MLVLLQVSLLARRACFQRHADKFSPTQQWQWTMALRGLSVVIELGLVTMVILYALIILGLGILGTRAIVLFSDWNFEPGHCRVHLGISDTKVLLLDNL